MLSFYWDAPLGCHRGISHLRSPQNSTQMMQLSSLPGRVEFHPALSIGGQFCAISGGTSE